MMIGRTDRIQVASEYTCLSAKGKPLLVSNAAGEEWGDTSMVGLNPMRLLRPGGGPAPDRTEAGDRSL